MTILSALSSFSRDDFFSNALPVTPRRRACRGLLAGHAYTGSLCAGAVTGNTEKYPGAGGEHRVDRITFALILVGPCKRSAAGQCAQSTNTKKPSTREGKPRVRHARNNSEVVTQINAAGTARSAEPGWPGPVRTHLPAAGCSRGSWRTLPRRSQRPEYGSALRWC